MKLNAKVQNLNNQIWQQNISALVSQLKLIIDSFDEPTELNYSLTQRHDLYFQYFPKKHLIVYELISHLIFGIPLMEKVQLSFVRHPSSLLIAYFDFSLALIWVLLLELI